LVEPVVPVPVEPEPLAGDAGGFPAVAPYGQTDTAHLLTQLERDRIALRRAFEDPVLAPVADPYAEAPETPADDPRLIGGPVW
jgi:hypothetical protein